MKRIGVGEYSIKAQYRVPNTDDELREMRIKCWDETTLFILDFKVPLPIQLDREISILIDKSELRKLIKKIL